MTNLKDRFLYLWVEWDTAKMERAEAKQALEEAQQIYKDARKEQWELEGGLGWLKIYIIGTWSWLALILCVAFIAIILNAITLDEEMSPVTVLGAGLLVLGIWFLVGIVVFATGWIVWLIKIMFG